MSSESNLTKKSKVYKYFKQIGQWGLKMKRKSKIKANKTTSALIIIIVLLAVFLIALYEKNGKVNYPVLG